MGEPPEPRWLTLGQCLLGKEPKEDFRIVEQKFRRNPHGSYQGWGLVVLPKEEGSPRYAVTSHK